jgi:hypothetical protein
MNPSQLKEIEDLTLTIATLLPVSEESFLSFSKTVKAHRSSMRFRSYYFFGSYEMD